MKTHLRLLTLLVIAASTIAPAVARDPEINSLQLNDPRKDDLTPLCSPTVFGHVVWENGQGAPDIPVKVFLHDDPGSPFCNTEKAFTTTTDDEGNFAVCTRCSGYTEVWISGEFRGSYVGSGKDFGTFYVYTDEPGFPNPTMSDVPTVAYSPSGTMAYTVTVRDINGAPVPGENVFVSLWDFHTDQHVREMVSFCDGWPGYALAVTNELGEATFNIEAGGCIDPYRIEHAPFEIVASAPTGGLYPLAMRGGVSSDAVNAAGRLPSDPAYVKPDPAHVGLSDATFHTEPLSSGLYEFCSDVDGDGAITLSDAVLLTEDLSYSASCDLE